MDNRRGYLDLLEEILSNIPSTAQSIANSFVAEHRRLESCPIVTIASYDEAALIRSQAKPQMDSRSIKEVLEQANGIFSNRIFNNHPRFFGFIPSPTHPLTLLGDLLLASKNPHAGSWFQSSGPSAIETGLIRWLAELAGLPADTAGGLFVSGGSMANLVGLQTARDQMLGEEWEQRARGTIYVSQQTHSSISKGLRILGFSNKQVRKIKCDENFQMDCSDLERTIEQDKEAGLMPFLIVASCGTTNTSSIDPISNIHTIAKAQVPPLWVHVDGAFGASVLLSKSHAHLLKDLKHADSMSWDAHKWLFQTYGCGMALLRDRRHLLQSFATGAEYTRDAVDSGDFESPNFWNFGPELTRPARGMRLWFSLQVLGLDAVGEMIDHGFLLAETVEGELRKLDGWKIVSNAKMGIVCFRYEGTGKSVEEWDELNAKVSGICIRENKSAALTTKLDGRTVIRICAIHPEMSVEGMKEVVRSLDEVARELAAI
ncbi:PLP-dependent transferase [Mollisia scopiformis]|uniref:PLP-dependent transferase n=1 Tax=Mollisia scopiformis TaxID=149040 RepID=A0A132B7T3_MOLSC|nr:PLP-dependent transferase [Mollisia scopiformis]KUJ08466.1 PLP-dependent transferase [Mollisia scopiformis]